MSRLLLFAAAAWLSGCALFQGAERKVVATARAEYLVERPDIIAIVSRDSARVDTLYEGGISALFAVGDSLFVVTDRGPSASAETRAEGGGPPWVFPVPDYVPTMYRVELIEPETRSSDGFAQGEARFVDPVPLLNAGGEAVSGRPVSAFNAGAGGIEVPWADAAGTPLAPDPSGLDVEGAAEGRAAMPPRMGVPGRPPTFWVADSYRPALIELDRETGHLFRRFTARLADAALDQPLDEALASRRPGEGFSGLARLDDGRLLAAMRSPLPVPDTTVDSRLVRLVLFDPLNGMSTPLAYELDAPTNVIGDLARAQGSRVLVLEHDESGSAWVYSIDLSKGSILEPSYGGRTVEELTTEEERAAAGFEPVPKRLELDLVKSGWDVALGPPEGLVALSPRTLVVVNDNRYGVDDAARDGTFDVMPRPTVFYRFRAPQSIWYEGTARLPLRERDLDVSEAGRVRDGEGQDRREEREEEGPDERP